jgi:hypothetical protein
VIEAIFAPVVTTGSYAAKNTMTGNRRVFCFYDRVVNLQDARELIALWSATWRSFGWEAQVLGMSDAKAHPMYALFRDKISHFYSRNVGNYDQLCWLRWLAFDFHGGGLMTDYDVINRCLIPQDIEPELPVIHEATRVPCCVSADAAGARTIVTRIMATNPIGQRIHFSDMNFFQAQDFPHTETCLEFGHAGWEEAKCVHFSRHAVHKWNKENRTGVRREDTIRRFIQT